MMQTLQQVKKKVALDYVQRGNIGIYNIKVPFIFY